MSITDELREFANGFDGPWRYNGEMMRTIANRIDAEHEKALAEQFNSLTVDMKPMTDENMAEGGWVRLPVDADGVPIRIGDRLVEPEYVPNGGTVVGIKLHSSFGHWLVNCGAWVDPRKCHHHEPTVEDLLADVADRAANLTGSYHEGGMNGDEYMDSMRALVAEYATKLRLADDGEEQ